LSLNQSINPFILLIQQNPTTDPASLSPLLTAAKVKGTNKVTKWRYKVKKPARKENFQKIISYREDALVAIFRKPSLNNIKCSNDLLCCRPICWTALLIYSCYLKLFRLCILVKLKFILFPNICVFFVFTFHTSGQCCLSL